MQCTLDDVVSALIGFSDMAVHLLRVIGNAAQIGKHRPRIISRLRM